MSHLPRQPRIFVVDDEHVIAYTTALILRCHGFDTAFFTSPLKALEAARLRAPDVLVSDIVMPQLSGIHLAMKITRHCPDCRVLLFSGQAGTFDMLDGARADGYNFNLLSKPVLPRVLIKAVQDLTGYVSLLPPFPEIQAQLLRHARLGPPSGDIENSVRSVV